jgi:hypothetical protein
VPALALSCDQQFNTYFPGLGSSFGAEGERQPFDDGAQIITAGDKEPVELHKGRTWFLSSSSSFMFFFSPPFFSPTRFQTFGSTHSR